MLKESSKLDEEQASLRARLIKTEPGVDKAADVALDKDRKNLGAFESLAGEEFVKDALVHLFSYRGRATGGRNWLLYLLV